MISINWEVIMVLDNNQKEENIKERVTKEIDSIKVPEGLKEELWTKVKPIPRKRKINSKVLPYIAAIACIAIFVPLVLSTLPFGSTPSDDLSRQTFRLAYPFMSPEGGPIKYKSIMTIEFKGGNVFTSNRYGDGKYELHDDLLVLQFENENEYLEIRFTLRESDEDFSKYSASISDVTFEMKDKDEISHFKNFYLLLDKDKRIEFLIR